MPVDDRAFQTALDALMLRVSVASTATVKTAGLAVQAAGMQHTPVLSGTLRRSWHTKSAGPYEVFVGPTVIYSRRISLGYKGPDSLGRTFKQAPNPYVSEAFTETLPKVRPIFLAAIGKAIQG